MVEARIVESMAKATRSPATVILTVANAVRLCWQLNAPLTAMVVFSLLSLSFSFSGLCLDHRYISGELAWIKPCKFGISIALYGLSLIWLERFLTTGQRLFRLTTMGALGGAILELLAIITQVLRGTTSHFNDATPIDAALWYMVKLSIMPVALAVIVLCILLMRQKGLPPVLGLSLRLGTLLTIVGLVPAIIMILPESAQQFITEVEVNGHTIGFVTGGPSIPWLGWSTVAGDLRAAHFVGLHSLQVIPLMGWAIARYLSKLGTRRQLDLVWNGSLTYFGVIALLTWQALRAESIVHPCNQTLIAYIMLLAFSTLACFLTLLPRPSQSFEAV
jgi:hypothetical protein